MHSLEAYLIGTENEIENAKYPERQLLHQAARSGNPRLLADGVVDYTEAMMRRSLKNAVSEAYGTISYVSFSIAATLLVPGAGAPFLADSACRAVQMARKATPVGLVGTLREYCQKE